MLSIPQLADDFEGRVIAPDDPDYESARTVFHVRVADAEDVPEHNPGGTWERLAAIKARYDPENGSAEPDVPP